MILLVKGRLLGGERANLQFTYWYINGLCTVYPLLELSTKNFLKEIENMLSMFLSSLV